MNDTLPLDLQTAPPAPLWRRLAAAIYDGFIVVALLFLGTALAMPFTHEAFSSDHPVIELVYRVYLLTIGFAFFGGFWVRTGQTLGMLTWRVQVVRSDGGGRISWNQALLRYLGALISWIPFGLGFWWAFYDQDKKTWHDRLSKTELRLAPSFRDISNRPA